MVTVFDFGDGKGPVEAYRHKNPNGSIGGWVAYSAAVTKYAHVDATATVFGNAQIRGYNNHIFGFAKVYDEALLEDAAVVKDNAQVFDRSVIRGHAVISGDAIVRGNARIGAHKKITHGEYVTTSDVSTKENHQRTIDAIVALDSEIG